MMPSDRAAAGSVILVVEDDEAVRLSLRLACQRDGFSVLEAADGAAAMAHLSVQRPDLVLLDLMLPGEDGFQLYRKLQTSAPELPVIIVTARDDESDKVRGLELGADDYITKPFSPRELLARVRAVLRRVGRGSDGLAERQHAPPEAAGLAIDSTSRTVRVAGRSIYLTPIECRILQVLAAERGRPLSRDALVSAVWGYEAEGATRLLDSHIAHLRSKIEPDPGHPRYLHTLRDVGYQLAFSDG